MKMKILALSAIALWTSSIEAKKINLLADTYNMQNNIPPRLQWDNNQGYCGEVSLISAGLYYGQYLSQYEARAIATKNALQSKGQLLLGDNDLYAANMMHLNAIEWNTGSQQNPEQFLCWIKQNVVKGYPVAIGIFTNEYRFYTDTDPDAGQDDYDHIASVIGIGSNHPLTDPSYYGDDILTFSDNGLWGNATNTPYIFSYGFDSFQADREQANAKKGPIYSLCNDGSNYGIAILGVMDLNGDTLPVRLSTSVNYEKPPIKNGQNTKPLSSPLLLTLTISSLTPNVSYNVYKYNSLDAVPNEKFNGNASKACATWHIQVSSGSTYVMTDKIQSDEVAVYRAVKASAP